MNLNSLKAYLKLSQMMVLDVLVYRADYISRYITFVARFLVSAYLWIAILSARGGELAGYNVKSMLSYFLLIQIVGALAFNNAGFMFSTMIQSGDLSNKLVHPISFPMSTFAISFGRSFFFFTTNLLLCIAIGLVFHNLFDFNLNWSYAWLALISMLMGFVLNFALVAIIGCLAFWTSTSNRFIFVYYATITLLSGTIIPPELFPESLQNILTWTPFPYLFYYPVHILQSSSWSAELSLGLALQAGYSALFMGIMYLVYGWGLRNYEAVGK